jgi:lysophospholipase L1-like esterase
MDLRPIHLFGDSIGKGILFDEGRGRYAIAHDRCDVQLQAALHVPVENHARMGATVAEGLQDFLECGDIAGTIVAIEYGGNDCDLHWDEVAKDPTVNHEAKVPLETFRRLLKEFVLKVRHSNAAPLLVTPPPLHAQRFFDWVTKGLDADAVLRYLIDVQNIYHWQERYAIAVRDAALETGCDIFDLRDVFLSRRDVADLISLDGMHPNAKGHKLIAESLLRKDYLYIKPALPSLPVPRLAKTPGLKHYHARAPLQVKNLLT